MLFFLISFFSFLLLFTKPLSTQLFPSWVSELRLLLVLFCQEFLHHSLRWLKGCRLVRIQVSDFSLAMACVNKKPDNVPEEEAAAGEMTILDLPELALECILGKLPPAGLCSMASVCRSLKDRCRSDHLWERHMREKWGRVIGGAAKREWELYVDSRKNRPVVSGGGGGKAKWWANWMASVYCIWPCSWMKSKPVINVSGTSHSLPVDSIVYWYLTLESGRFWFPAQVYNRENGHVGFMLSCYDAKLSYDSRTDTFHARYPPLGRKGGSLEEEVQWDRLRVAPVDTPAHELHISDCLNDLQPGDHIEIQWRKSKEFPYGWWYGVVGHLESCDGNEHYCHCHDSDTIILEFNQYTPGSRWRQTAVDRKEHREEGNETDGFYGGIRKLRAKDDISMWRRLWPAEVLE